MTVGFIVPGSGGDGTWVDGALTARDRLEARGVRTETVVGMLEALPGGWQVAVCHGGQYAPIVVDRADPDLPVILSDRDVLPGPVACTTEIDWGWSAAFALLGRLVPTLVSPDHRVSFLAGAAVPTQHSLVEAFLTGLREREGTGRPVRTTYLSSFDDVAGAEELVRSELAVGGPALVVSSSDGAGLAGLRLAAEAGLPTVSFLSGLREGETAAVVSDIPGVLTDLVLRSLAGESLPARLTLTPASGRVGVVLGAQVAPEAHTALAAALAEQE